MTNEEILQIVKEHFNNEYIAQATFDFRNNSIDLIIVPPASLERISFDCVSVNKEND